MGNIIARLVSIVLSVPGLVIALSFHEFAHAYSAHLLGDDTAKWNGRMTLNPMNHFDLFGTLCLLFVGIGWGKPVPVNGRNFKNYKRDNMLVSLAGPAMNFLLAIVFSFLTVLTEKFVNGIEYYSAIRILNGNTDGAGTVGIITIVFFILNFATQINVSLGIFNLIPVPPLDGSKVLFMFLPDRIIFKFREYERYITLALFVLLFFGVLSIPISYLSEKILGFLFGIWEGILL